MTDVSVIIAARNRPAPLQRLLDCLAKQTHASFEVIVVDDGSTPPLPVNTTPLRRVIRTDGVERSRARNLGVAAAAGQVVLFLDDDLTIEDDFIARHWTAQRTWPGALVVGRIQLPQEIAEEPFGRFRQRLENTGIPASGGPVSAANFCTAANMSVPTDVHQRLGGFDPAMVSGEDQDFAMRFTALGGTIVYAPDALAIHHDSVVGLRAYCRRVEWAFEKLLPFVRSHPAFAENADRVRINGPIEWTSDAPSAIAKKMLKSVFAIPFVSALLLTLARVMERIAPRSTALDRLYAMSIGIFARRGFLRALREEASQR
jgi:glycosyltransferase involved in cell wall biosynthesis